LPAIALDARILLGKDTELCKVGEYRGEVGYRIGHPQQCGGAATGA